MSGARGGGEVAPGGGNSSCGGEEGLALPGAEGWEAVGGRGRMTAAWFRSLGFCTDSNGDTFCAAWVFAVLEHPGPPQELSG